MRCYIRRLIYVLLFIVSWIFLCQLFLSTHKFKKSQAPFQIILYKNHTYRILSSSYKYNSRGSYLNFAYFNVEQRNRVLYIDYLYDVPVSSQWKSNGHLYPIQISQFGLSHWSRLELSSQNDIYKFEQIQPNKDKLCSSWYTIKTKILLSNTFIHFTISLNTSLHFYFIKNQIELIYSTMNNQQLDIPMKIFIPLKGSPHQVNRHMLIDIEKSLKKLVIKQDYLKIQVCGNSSALVRHLIIGNQTLYNEQAFYSAIHWLLNTQDSKTGCWFIHVQRNDQDSLQMPWCSAMAQGQAASLFVRLYTLTTNSQHLLAIRQAIKPLWSSNITRAYFNKQYLWLEEYPLKSSYPGLFVLNGCLYALIGIIDVYTIDPQTYLLDLINEMIFSLYHMLPYYIHPKNSNWSLYDLSHITMKTKLNSASYSYHLVHITLLQCLSQLFHKTNLTISTFFDSYAQRFISGIL